MIQRLFIPGRLPGLNEILDAKASFDPRQRGRFRQNGYASLKRRWTAEIILQAHRQRLRPVACPRLRFTWVEPNRRRDKDNIAAGGRKIILDALVRGGFLGGDAWKDYLDWQDIFTMDPDRPGVLVEIEDRGTA